MPDEPPPATSLPPSRPRRMPMLLAGIAVLCSVLTLVIWPRSRKDSADAYPVSGMAEAEALLGQMRFLQVETTQWYVQFGLEPGGQWAPRLIGIAPDNKRFDNRVSAANPLKPGDVFFTEGEAFKNRFRFIGMAKKELVSERTQVTEVVEVAEFEDLKPGKTGTRYESQSGLPQARIGDHSYRDRTAVLDIAPGGGERWKLEVEEGTPFKLPDTKGGVQSFLLKELTEDAIVIEYDGPAGTRKVRTLPRLKAP